MSAFETLVVFAASFLVGAVGGVVWAVGRGVVGSASLLAPLFALLGHLLVVDRTYPGGWPTAGVAGFDTFGLPGV